MRISIDNIVIWHTCKPLIAVCFYRELPLIAVLDWLYAV